MTAVIHLVASLLLSPISFDISLRQYDGVPIVFTSPERNVSLSVNKEGFFVEDVLISSARLFSDQPVFVHCKSGQLDISTETSSGVLHSGSLCSTIEGLVIDPTSLYGCISNVRQGSKLLFSRLCSNGASEKADKSTSREDVLFGDEAKEETTPIQPVYVAEPLQVNEGAAMALQWKNVYVLPQHSRLNISNFDIVFSLVSLPSHGQLVVNGTQSSTFHYADLLGRRVVYRHDGSETREDSFEFQIEINTRNVDFPWLDSATYMLKIVINGVNDAPELAESTEFGSVVKVPAKGSRQLTTEIIRVADPDDGPDKVRLQVVEQKGVHLAVDGVEVSEVTQRQILAEQVSIVDDGVYPKGVLKLVARDASARSNVLTINTVSVPVEIRLAHNTGVRLLHHSSVQVSSSNLSFTASVPDLPIFYSVVGLPDHGVIECGTEHSQYQVCARFSQEQVDSGLVRYRHTGTQQPTADTFSFQVESGDFVSMVYTFRLMFIPMNVKVFNREVFMLNGTDVARLERHHLFAWTFPKSFTPEKLVYYIVEPPKFGILSRKVGTRNRRIGVSSNFTQEDVDSSLVSYKLHFMQYSIVNDYFLFRVISPAVSSEILRFEIVFVPSPTSIQLVNRTVVVEEGGTKTIGSDFLSLSTADDRQFVFTVWQPPQHGQLWLKGGASGGVANVPIIAGHNFTTQNVQDGRLFYVHSGDESLHDGAHLVAESAHRAGTRVPFWLTMSVILRDDNAPRLDGSDTVLLAERGERTLHPFLLPWKDDDLDAPPLEFVVAQQGKDVAILSSVSPHLPLTRFTSDDLKEGRVLVRHLGHHNEYDMKYTVSDGAHTVDGVLKLRASEPFVKMHANAVEYCCDEGDRPMIVIDPRNLSVLTNMDVRPAEIVYHTVSTHFSLKEAGKSERSVGRFTQQDILDHSLLYQVHSARSEPLTVRVGERMLQTELLVSRRQLGEQLELRRNAPLSLPVRSAATIDNKTLQQADGSTLPDQLFYVVVQQPSEGHLLLEQSSLMSGGGSLARFSQADVDSGRVQYLHGGGGAGRDRIRFNITSPHTSKGVYTLNVEIYEHHVSLNTSSLSVLVGESAVIGTQAVVVSSSDKDDHFVRVTRPPRRGWIVRDTWNLADITSIESFSGAELRERRVHYVSDRKAVASSAVSSGGDVVDEVELVACISADSCTQPRQLTVRIQARNVHSPQLLRNEVLRVMSADSAAISNEHLSTEDTDTPADSIRFLISKPTSGHVARLAEPDQPIYSFSQREVDEGKIVFRRGESTGSGGFSFLISDGVHQVGPEWFTIESGAGVNVMLEANARLLAAPLSSRAITIEMLRVNIPGARADQVLFSVTRPPKHGKLQIGGKGVYRFSQQDINRRSVMYAANDDQVHWSRRDSFNFVVSVNGSSKPVEEEHRFRILSTYAALSDAEVEKLVPTGEVAVSKGGSTALNSSHIDVSPLAKRCGQENLQIEIAKAPSHGEASWADAGRSTALWSEVEAGRAPLVYRHYGDSPSADSLTLFVYPLSEPTRAGSRLRVRVPIRVHSWRDREVQVVRFPRQLPLVAASSTPLSPLLFSVTHPHVPPQSVRYQVIQFGRSGVSVQRDGREVDTFSQQEVNSNLLSFVHQSLRPQPLAPSDVVVFSVEGHTRAVIVKIRPLDLALENLTEISYPQGKTYVVLNRSHLAVYGGVDPTSVHYRVTQPPENGTLYWVAGEKEARNFSQSDIDNGRVLYAQLNMNAYQDSFEFTVSSSGGRVQLRERSQLRVRSLAHALPIIVETRTTTQMTSSMLNASRLQAARFRMLHPPQFGRIVVLPKPGEMGGTSGGGASGNESAQFFTAADVDEARVMYESVGGVEEESIDRLLLEVRAEGTQPALLTLPITVLPADEEELENPSDVRQAGAGRGGGTSGGGAGDGPTVPRMTPINNQLPVIILFVILGITVFVLLCRRRGGKQPVPPPSPTVSRPLRDRPDLLGSTVFASVGAAEAQQHQQQHPMTQHNHMHSPQQTMMRTFERPSNTTTPSSQRRHRPLPAQLDYAGLDPDTPPAMPLFQQVAAQQAEKPYWV